MIESVVNNTTLISEILIAKIDATDDYESTYKLKNTKITRFGLPLQRTQQGIEHALGLHACIDKSTENYILLSDPDVIYYKGLDSFYLKIIDEYNLDVIGLAHHSSIIMAYSFSPWIGNYLSKKEKLPNNDFLKNYLAVRDGNGTIKGQMLPGKYLIPNKIPEYAQEFPNPDGHFDTGSNLALWNKWSNNKWLSFQTLDCHNYGTKFYKGNVKITKRIESKKLLYHLVGVTNNRPNALAEFTKAYEISKIE
jgi:hypothetical protein